MKLINIGFGNIVSASRLVAIVSPESAPIKRIIQDAKDRGTLIDATYGRRTRAVLVTDSDHVILSAVQPETVANRLSDREDEGEEIGSFEVYNGANGDGAGDFMANGSVAMTGELDAGFPEGILKDMVF